jgi:hypothetical protein
MTVPSGWPIRLRQYADKFMVFRKKPKRRNSDVTGAGKENTHAVMMNGYFPRKKRFAAPRKPEPRAGKSDD